MNYPKVSQFPAPLGYPALNLGVGLVTAGEKKTIIAGFHRAHYFMKKQKARLEVQPAGMGMLD